MMKVSKKTGCFAGVRVSHMIVCLSGLLIAVSPAALAVDRNWDDGGDGTNWFDVANWDTGVPAAGDNAIIGAGYSVRLTNSTDDLGSFTILNSTLTFVNWNTALNATNVTIQSGGKMQHTLCDINAADSKTNRVYVCCSNLTIDVNGSINVDELGYRGSTNVSEWGQGAGGGYQQGGGGYGGTGGIGAYDGNTGGPPCGVAAAPIQPGSGGGRWNTAGGHGGGAVLIDATGKVTVNGTISANGITGTHGMDGTGSGGGIYITCRAFTGNTNGIIRANGGVGALYGNEYFGGTGAGGRIAVVYNAAAQSNLNLTARPFVRFSANAGKHYTTIGNEGKPGTLYFTDSSFYPANTLLGGQIVITGFTSWSTESLTAEEGLVVFPSAFQLTLTNSMTITGVRAAIEFTNNCVVNIGGDFTLTNGGRFYAYSGMTNGATDYGLLVSVAGDVNIGTECWIFPESHPTNGGSALFRMRNLTIVTNGGFDADGKGYACAPGSDDRWGYGPGAGYKQGGGGYGGIGGVGRYGGTNGAAYGSSNAPVQPGSGGGASTTHVGTRGGGAVRIEASEQVTVNGTISANGEKYNEDFWQGGTGSGGGIYIRCLTFTGDSNSLLQADGGEGMGGSDYRGGTGGGGRIAVWRTYHTYQGTASATNGTPHTWPAGLGEPGTVVWGLIPPPGTIIRIR